MDAGGFQVGGILIALVIVFGILIGIPIFLIVKATQKKNPRDTREGFMGAVSGTSALPCGRASYEAEKLFDFFAKRPMTVGEGEADLRDLKNLLSRFACLKTDLMAPQHLIAATKELGFATHLDIQPVADLTARCFSKTIPERDLSIQFIKWRDAGLDLIRRLCTATNTNEEEVRQAEALFRAAWGDVYDVASVQCLKTDTDDKLGPHDVAPRTPENVRDLREQDGQY